MSALVEVAPFDYAAQSRTALDRANVVKQQRMVFRKELAAMKPADSRLCAARILEDPPEWLWNLEIGKLLGWVHRLGQRHVGDLCSGAEVSSIARVGGAYHSTSRPSGPVLSERQRLLLAHALRSL